MPYINMSLCKNFQQCLGKALGFLLPSKTPEYEGEKKLCQCWPAKTFVHIVIVCLQQLSVGTGYCVSYVVFLAMCNFLSLNCDFY